MQPISYEPTRHYSGATELNTAGRRAEILARWTVFTKAAIMVYSVPTGQLVPTSGQVVDWTCECSGVSTTGFYQLTGSVQLKLLNDRCSTKLPLPRNPPLLEM